MTYTTSFESGTRHDAYVTYGDIRPAVNHTLQDVKTVAYMEPLQKNPGGKIIKKES